MLCMQGLCISCLTRDNIYNKEQDKKKQIPDVVVLGKGESLAMGSFCRIDRTGERREVSRQNHRSNGRHETTYAPWEDGGGSDYLRNQRREKRKGKKGERSRWRLRLREGRCHGRPLGLVYFTMYVPGRSPDKRRLVCNGTREETDEKGLAPSLFLPQACDEKKVAPNREKRPGKEAENVPLPIDQASSRKVSRARRRVDESAARTGPCGEPRTLERPASSLGALQLFPLAPSTCRRHGPSHPLRPRRRVSCSRARSSQVAETRGWDERERRSCARGEVPPEARLRLILFFLHAYIHTYIPTLIHSQGTVHTVRVI
ncbi:hypothetical protein V8C42DRAFT_79728 [Trichoderma barbatum]